MIINMIKFFVLIVFVVFSTASFSAEFDWTSVLNFLDALSPIVHIVLTILGALVVLGTTIDKLIPDEYDKGFMGVILAIPVLGGFLKAITKFSPFNYRQ